MPTLDEMFLQRDKNKINQPVNFVGIRIGSITPTDIDLFVEYHNIAFIFVDFKYKGAICPSGQITAIKRIVDAIRRGGGIARFIIAEHDVADPSSEIRAATAKVIEFYDRKDFVKDERGLKLSEFIDEYILAVENLEYKQPSIIPAAVLV